MRHLYDITKELDSVREEAFNIAEDNNGEIPDYIGDMLDTLEGEREEKIQRIGEIYKDISAFEDSIAKEQSRLSKLKTTAKNEQERIKQYLSAFMDEGEKFKTSTVSIGWRKSTSVNLLVDAEQLPDEFKKIDVKPKKTDITKAIKSGKDLSEYAELVTVNNIGIK